MTTTFQYKVRNKEGKLIEGSLESESKALVVEKLRGMGFVPVSIEESGNASTGKFGKDMSFGGKKLKTRDLAVFSRQFATMINSGLPLIRAIDILSEQSESKLLSEADRGDLVSMLISQIRSKASPAFLANPTNQMELANLDAILKFFKEQTAGK